MNTSASKEFVDLAKKAFLILALIFALGSGIFFAVNAFAPTNFNEYTGRARAFDLEYWDCIAGASVIILTSLITSIIKTELEK